MSPWRARWAAGVAAVSVVALGALLGSQKQKPASAEFVAPVPTWLPASSVAAGPADTRDAIQSPPPVTMPAGVLPGGAVSFPKTIRSFSQLSPEEAARFRQLEGKFWSASNPADRMEILDEIDGGAYGSEFVSLASRIMALHDDALSLRVLDLLAGNTSAAILPVLAQALGDPSPQIRQQAVLAADQVRDDAVVGFFGKAYEDPDANVRMSSFNALDSEPRDLRVKVLSRAFASTNSDVQTTSIDLLQLESSPQSLEAVIPALDSPSAQLREAAQSSLEFQLDQSFPNATVARAWWNANRDKFDQNLAPK